MRHRDMQKLSQLPGAKVAPPYEPQRELRDEPLAVQPADIADSRFMNRENDSAHGAEEG